MRKLMLLVVSAVVLVGSGSSIGATRSNDITLGAGKDVVVYGQSTTLNGTLANLTQASGSARIQIFRALGVTSTAQATEAFSVLADDAGNFSVTVAPTIGTTFFAAYTNPDGTRLTSDPITVSVRPKVTLSRYARRGSRFFFRTSVKSDYHSYGRLVTVQRLA